MLTVLWYFDLDADPCPLPPHPPYIYLTVAGIWTLNQSTVQTQMLIMALDQKLKVPQIIQRRAEYMLHFMTMTLVFVETLASDRLIKSSNIGTPTATPLSNTGYPVFHAVWTILVHMQCFVQKYQMNKNQTPKEPLLLAKHNYLTMLKYCFYF